MQPFVSIHPSHSSAPQAAVSRVLVWISGALPALLLPEGTVPQLAIDPVLAPVPNCKSWFRGVYGMRGTLVPVFDVAAACGLPAADLKFAQVLVLDQQHQPVGIVCTQSPQVISGMVRSSMVFLSDRLRQASLARDGASHHVKVKWAFPISHDVAR